MKTFEAEHVSSPARLRSIRDVDRDDEIDRLAATFDRMKQRIREQIQELERVDRVRRELIANVSHDLRTPLAALQGYVETLVIKRDELSAEERERYLQIASRHCTQLARRVNDLFELAKLDAAAVRLEIETVSLPELAHDVAQKFQLEAERKGVRLEIGGERRLPFVEADIRLVERVIENLVGNAIRHTPRGGEVMLSTDKGPECVRVSVRDTGPGIAAEELPSIFDRFYRCRDRDEETSGAGLGLAIAKRIVELHGGEISARSEPKSGARFTFDLPLGSRRDVTLA
jgi:signal transduction histidine kinase